jgi:hypothetical protein
MIVTGYMLRVKPHWGRRSAFIMAFITFVCAAQFRTQHWPKSDIDKVFHEFLSLEALNFPGAAVGAAPSSKGEWRTPFIQGSI